MSVRRSPRVGSASTGAKHEHELSGPHSEGAGSRLRALTSSSPSRIQQAKLSNSATSKTKSAQLLLREVETVQTKQLGPPEFWNLICERNPDLSL